MPSAPSLPTSISGGATGHLSHSQTVHGIINTIYKADIATTQTGNFTIAQSQSGEAIRVNSASAVTVTVPVLEAGTSMEIIRMGAGTVTLSASSTTFRHPSDLAASCRAQYSSISLLWLTTSEVLVSGDLT